MGSTLSAGQKELAEIMLCNGAGARSSLDAFIKAQSGNMVFKLTPSTAAIVHTSAGWVVPVVISLESTEGERDKWYNGPITLSFADTSAAGTLSIAPSTTTVNMVDGAYTVNMVGSATAWLAAETATLTVAAATILGYTVASKTCVVTIS